MGKYIVKRITGVIFVLLGITIFSFFLANISRVDPAEAYVRRHNKMASQEQIEKVREELGYHLPLYQQYMRWLLKAAQGNLGDSLRTGDTVIQELSRVFPDTLQLVGAAWVIIALTVIPIGVLCVIYKNSLFDKIISTITLLGISIPGFWLGFLLLYYFSVTLKLVPVVSYGASRTIILPAITLATPIVASSIRLLRASMLENTHKDFVVFAKARGIDDKKIMWVHILKNSLPPIITLFGQTIGYMIAGTAIVESVFSWNGLGNYALKAILARDLPVINGVVLIMAIIFVVCNLLADSMNIAINPIMLKESGEV